MEDYAKSLRNVDGTDKLEEEFLEVPRQMPLAPVSEEVIEMDKQENNDKVEYNMKQFNFQIHVVTVSNFLMRWVPITNMKPVGQRPAVEDPIIMDTRGTKPSKAQSIISILSSITFWLGSSITGTVPFFDISIISLGLLLSFTSLISTFILLSNKKILVLIA